MLPCCFVTVLSTISPFSTREKLDIIGVVADGVGRVLGRWEVAGTRVEQKVENFYATQKRVKKDEFRSIQVKSESDLFPNRVNSGKD